MIAHIQQRLRTPQAKKLMREFRVVRIAVFGSAAKGRMKANSDIDFLVEFEPEADLFDQAGLRDGLSRLFKCDVDVLTEQGLHKSMRAQILKEAIEV